MVSNASFSLNMYPYLRMTSFNSGFATIFSVPSCSPREVKELDYTRITANGMSLSVCYSWFIYKHISITFMVYANCFAI